MVGDGWSQDTVACLPCPQVGVVMAQCFCVLASPVTGLNVTCESVEGRSLSTLVKTMTLLKAACALSSQCAPLFGTQSSPLYDGGRGFFFSGHTLQHVGS